jgi:hypothetical protein
VIIPVGRRSRRSVFLDFGTHTLGDEVIQRQSLGKRALDTDPIAACECIPGGDQPSQGTTMRHLLAVMAAFALMTGVAVAQGTPGSGSSTTTVTSGPNGSKARAVARRRTARPKLIRRAAAQRPARHHLPGPSGSGVTLSDEGHFRPPLIYFPMNSQFGVSWLGPQRSTMPIAAKARQSKLRQTAGRCSYTVQPRSPKWIQAPSARRRSTNSPSALRSVSRWGKRRLSRFASTGIPA